jgi:hypothetical protein
MNVEKHLKSQLLCAIAFMVIGSIALLTLLTLWISGNLDGKLAGIFIGLTLGFLPVGIGLVVDYYRIKRNPVMQKQIELKNEERNVFLRNKSGYESLNLMIWLIFGLWFLNMWVNIASFWVFPVLLGMMGISYFTFLSINAKKY